MSECMTQEDAERMDNEQAVAILKPLRDMMRDQYGCPISDAYFALDKAITALLQPQRTNGRWTEKTVSENPQACGIREWQSAKCSVCGKYHSTPYLYSFTDYAFCPCCGSDMRGEEE